MVELSHYIQLELFYLFSSIYPSIYAISRLTMTIFFYLPPLSHSGQITQWNLIFYGTSDPPQKNDPPRYLGNNKKTAVNDLIHNSLENSQWGFITQDVSAN